MFRLRELRDERGMSLDDLADALHVNKSTLSRIENEQREPKESFIRECSDYFNVSTDYLLGKTDLKNYSDYHPALTAKDERDIQKELEKMMADLGSGQSGPAFYGGNMNLSEDDREVLKGSLEQALRIIKLKNKETYTPYKHRKNTDAE